MTKKKITRRDPLPLETVDALPELLANRSQALGKKGRERKRTEARKAKRATYDLPPKLKQKIAEIAKNHECPASQIAHLLLLHGLKELEAGNVEIESRKYPSKSPLFEWNLRIDESVG